jgi:uncharacterized repeat protein (TIGR04138 family)
MSNFQAYARLADVVRRDPRYRFEAYEFIFNALAYTLKMLGRPPAPSDPAEAAGPEHHVSGSELLEGARALAVKEFGLMAPVVFRSWGIRRTDDFGEIVFNLVEENLMSKNEQDCRADFHNLFDLDRALVEGFRIELDEVEWPQ